MCRKNLIPAALLAGLGAGLLLSCCIRSCLLTLFLAAAAIGGGICLANHR